MINADFLKKNTHLKKYIKSCLKDLKFDIYEVPNQSFLVGSVLSSIIENFLQSDNIKEYNMFSLLKDQDIDIFVKYDANRDFVFSGKLEVLNKKTGGYSHTRKYDTFFKDYPTYSTEDPNDRYRFVTKKQRLPLHYYIAGNIKDNIVDYTFMHTDSSFSPLNILESFDFNSLKVLYSFDEDEIYFEDEYIEYLNTKEIITSHFVNLNSFIEEYDQILPSLLRMLKKTDNTPNYKQLCKLYFSILLNVSDIDNETILHVNYKEKEASFKINNNKEMFSVISFKYINVFLANLDFFENIFYIEETKDNTLTLKLKNYNSIRFLKDGYSEDFRNNFIEKFKDKKTRDENASKINFVFDLLYKKYSKENK